VLLAGIASFGVYWMRKAPAGPAVAHAQVRKGEFLVLVRCRGALRARQSVAVYTPVIPNLRIAWLAPDGETIAAGQLIVRFDSSSAQQQLMQRQAQLKQAQATLDQALAQSKITGQQDRTELADARFALERAGVAVEQASIKSRIDGDKARVDLGVAEQKLRVQEATVGLHEASDRSRIASLTRQRDQAASEVELTKSRIAQMELKAPGDGLLTLNNNCAGAIVSADCKPYKVGDNVSSSIALGQVPDLKTLEMDVSVEEADRGRVGAGQDALVRVDALAELTIPVKVRGLSSLAEMRMEYPYTRSFRAYASIQNPDGRLRPGMNGAMDVIVSRIANALSIPSKALFTRSGKPVVYLARDGRWVPVNVEVIARNPDEVAISGVTDGATVALVDIEKRERPQ
jgi:HlyD family secretion protein